MNICIYIYIYIYLYSYTHINAHDKVLVTSDVIAQSPLALIIDAEPREMFKFVKIRTRKTKATSTMESRRQKKSKQFHLHRGAEQ